MRSYALSSQSMALRCSGSGGAAGGRRQPATGIPARAAALLRAGALLLAGLLLAWAPPLYAAGLNEHCMVSVLNRNVQARADGTWVLPNLPANFGRVRARATCVEGGVTTYGQSAEFVIPANGSITLPPIVLGPTTPIPTNLRVTVPDAVLASPGATTQLRAQATYAAGNEADVTASGTSFSISNPAIATITPAGLVTAVRSGTVVIQAINEGTQGIAQLRVALAGADSDGDGIPDDEELRLGMNPNNAADALLDLDRDGLAAVDEYRAGTDPRNADSDGDGLKDGAEVQCGGGFCTSPVLADTDGDGVRDGTEIRTGSDPTSAASVNFGAALQSIRVTPATFTLIVNALTGSASVQLTVTGTMIDGVEIDLTSTARQTTYASSNIASCNFGAPDGRVHASSAGSCDITVANNGHSAAVRGTVQDFVPGALSYLPIPGFANGVAVSGEFAFIAAGSAGLQVVALGADRRTPSILASLNLDASANDITLAGNLAFLATSGGLKVVDVTTPTAPRLLGTFAGTPNAMGVKVRGTTAYVVAGATLYIVSVANPGAMIQAGAIALGGTGWNVDVDLSRNLAAVAMGGAGLQLVDISNLSAPLLRGTASTGDARGVALRGTTAIVADYASSMTSVDIADPAAPVVLSSTPQALGGLLTNVTLAGNFALGADVAFVNGVPIVDIGNPATLQPRAILAFADRDDNGMGIATDDSYVYLVADRNSLERGGSSGDSRLYIGQYQPRIDLAGVPPTATITAPANGTQVYEGAPLTIAVDAQDDITVASVRFLVNGLTAFTSTGAPYQYTMTVPRGVSALTLGAVARDLGGNEGSAAAVTVGVVPDPLTQAVGQVVDAAGTPLAGALVTAPGGRTGTTGADGRFVIREVPTVLGNLVLQAAWTPAGGAIRNGASAPTPPVPGGVTDVGIISVIDVRFETEYGTLWTTCDDCFTQRTLPFTFPFYGTDRSTAFVGSNGYLTFDSGDSTYREDVPAFTRLPRIAAFFDDLIGGGGVLINDQLPDRFVVTYDRTRQYSEGGSNTLQIQLYRDGRIVFAYKGMTALRSGAIAGITPGPDAPFQQVDYSATPALEVPAGSAVYEYFTAASQFDLDNSFVVLTPNAAGGYSVRTILPPAAVPTATLTAAPPLQLAAPTALRARQAAAPSGAPLAGAEVRVTSSGNPRYRGMANTDAAGGFTLKGVPPGGINVEVWRDGSLLARGAALTSAADRQVPVELVAPEAKQKR
ncbi:carboxypeptidase regulatory-like domain-containing protein [Pseudoduganella chitinolytica]|uniref:Carboxypeptidase regulatory-like domain-containing protein n=1 Tax=Pseudoduganella chitinolytica TaxID=34070 RepID=A0ABY8BHS1_9BURK|nr:carboxypeptidase regulatory-like domain-containing protein [Pseudoduganella chitinolytica]WEF33904.1 carboxypeptidase regulatory-like domain-containing protein [Pseudoduganella chitinolytica]